MKPKLIILYVLIIITSCKKDPNIIPEKSNTECPEKYETNTREYINPFMGPLQTTVLQITLRSIYTENFVYSNPLINPNNPYEFCFFRTRVENQETVYESEGLYKYNFCTNRVTFIADQVQNDRPDWSVKDWILISKFGLYKIKSNGDSLTQLSSDNNFLQAKWNTTGTMYLWSAKEIFDEHGISLYKLPSNISPIDWYDEWQLLYSESGTQEINKYDIRTGQSEFFASKPSNESYWDYNATLNEFMGSGIYSNGGFDFRLRHVNTNTSTLLSTHDQNKGFRTLPNCQIGNKILVTQILTDSLTGTFGEMNVRVHIAMMNRDGSNIRQVLIPED